MQGQKGFTVIEVTLFLGLTGLLIVMMLAGSGQLIARTRFTDGTRGLESFVQRQYEEVVSGVNSRTGAEVCSNGNVTTSGSEAPGTSDCVLLGKVVTFASGSTSVTTRYVVGNSSSSPNPSETANAILEALNPQIVSSIGEEVYQTPWDVRFTGGRRADNMSVTSIGFLRSPNSTKVNTYLLPNVSNNLFVPPVVAPTTNTTAYFCLANNDFPVRKAALQIGNGQGASSIRVVYEGVPVTSC